MEERVILVDEHDAHIGVMEKLEAHRKGLLHRAISVVIFNAKGEMLVQQRAAEKYHCPGLWANACCTHPRPGEETLAAAHRRLVEEMGFDCELRFAFPFTYRAVFDNGLIEHEFDHVFVGTYDGPVHPNPDEVGAFAWWSEDELSNRMSTQPETLAPWFVLIVKKITAREKI